MNNFFNSFDTPADRSVQAKVWQAVGLVLIGGGLLVMAWAGWMYVSQQAELSDPPAPIIDSSAVDPLEPLPPVPPPPTEEAVAAAQSSGGDTRPVKPAPLLTPSPPVTETAPPAVEGKPLPGPTGEGTTIDVNPTEIIADEPTAEKTTIPLEIDAGDMPSLTDNPLPVVEDVNEIEPEPDSAFTRNAATAPPTRMVAASIALDTPVVTTGWVQAERDGILTNVWVVADYAAGWHENSALPGEGGNIVLSGHHNIKGEVFREIVNLEVGDTVSLFVNDEPYDYVVRDKFIVKDKDEPDSVRRANAKWIGPFNEERLTLVTCWPYTNNTHRVIVIAQPL